VDDPTLDTTQLLGWQKRIRAGDTSARDELLRAAGGQLERLARNMLRRFPSVSRWAETGDVLQGALLRLLRALGEVECDSVRSFFGLAAEQLRRELIDLARHFHGRYGIGANHASGVLPGDSRAPRPEPADRADDPDELERWCAFHRAVEKLPAEEREVVGLIYYHGWTREQVAELLQVTDRTVRRWWRSAMTKLHDTLKEEGEEA
jgi:RNA polymerase sigma-70 factor (ECF subfamily)